MRLPPASLSLSLLLVTTAPLAQDAACPGVRLGETSRPALLAHFGTPVDERRSGPKCGKRDVGLFFLQPKACRPLNEPPFAAGATLLASTDRTVAVTLLFEHLDRLQRGLLERLAAAHRRNDDAARLQSLGSGTHQVIGAFDDGDVLIWVTVPAEGAGGPPYLQVIYALREHVDLMTRDLNACD